jgi:hypothetical protein
MARFIVVSPQDWPIVAKYMRADGPDQNIVLISPEAAEEFEAKHDRACPTEIVMNYDFGDNPDRQVDIVQCLDAYSLDCLCEYLGLPTSFDSEEET